MIINKHFKMEIIKKKLDIILNNKIFSGHSKEEDKSKIFISYPLIRASFVLYGLVNKMKEYDLKHWRYFARMNLFFIFYDINKKYGYMDENTRNEYKLKYGSDLFFWHILASHLIPYRFVQIITYKFYENFNKSSPRNLCMIYVPILFISLLLYPTFFKIGDNLTDFIFNYTYRFIISDYRKVEKIYKY